MKKSMKTVIRVLAIAAVVQIALVGVAYMGGDELQASQSSVALLSFQPNSVDTVTIYGPDKQAVTLHKHGGWKTDGGFPADGARIGQLLQQLSDLKHGLAVATSPSAWARFKLADDDFERHLVLRKGDQVVAELYLGKGAGARHSYARNSHDPAAYSVALGSYEMPLDESQWQDKTLLQIPADQLTGLDIAGLSLVKTAAKPDSGKKSGSAAKKKTEALWRADSTPAGKQLDQHAVQQALQLLATLRFDKVLGKQPPAGFDAAHPTWSVTAHRHQSARQYHFFKSKNGDKYMLKVSDRPEYFSVSSYTFKAWQKRMSHHTLFVDAPVGQPATAGSVDKSGIPASIAMPDKKEKAVAVP